MGVTEELVPIDTRDILEKGITAHGAVDRQQRTLKQLLKA